MADLLVRVRHLTDSLGELVGHFLQTSNESFDLLLLRGYGCFGAVTFPIRELAK